MSGNCHYQSGELEDAIRCFDMTLGIRRKYPKALYNTGVALGELGRFEEAVLLYDECLAVNPGVAMVMTNKAVALARLRRL